MATLAATELARLQTARNTLRTKAVELGIGLSTDKLDALATGFSGIENRGAVNANVTEGSTYTIPKGYHNGSGVVAGVAGGGNYSLQEKSVTPTKAQQNVTSDEGYYGLSAVTVKPIPDNFQDVSATTAAEGDVLTGKVFTAADGTVTTGEMPNNGAVSKTLDATTNSYTVPKGYHSGTGKVSINPETKTVTPTKAAQNITPTTGKVLSKVTVEPIPAAYQDVTGVTATADKVLDGSVFVDADGNEVDGTMVNHGAVLKVLSLDDGQNYYDIPKGYHDGSGSVRLNPEPVKEVTPTKSQQVILAKTGHILGGVVVKPIPDDYITTTDADAVAGEILDGKFAYVKGVKLEGSMPNNGATSGSIDGLTTTSFIVPAGYTTGGTIELTDDIARALADI